MPIYFIKDQAIGPVFTTEQPAREAQLLADGYTRVDDPGQYSRETHTYVDGVFVSIPAPTSAELLAAAKHAKQGELLANVNKFIAEKPDGKTRYDTNLKLNLLDWRDEIRDINADAGATAAQQAWAGAAGPMIGSVKAWISAVQGAYLNDRKVAVAGAADLADLKTLDISYDWFESRYGLAGTIQADPDVYTSDIVTVGQ